MHFRALCARVRRSFHNFPPFSSSMTTLHMPAPSGYGLTHTLQRFVCALPAVVLACSAAFSLCSMPTSALAQDNAATITPVTDAEVAKLMPKHGTVCTAPAKFWENGLAAGNGTMGAMLYGHPSRDTLL